MYHFYGSPSRCPKRTLQVKKFQALKIASFIKQNIIAASQILTPFVNHENLWLLIQT